MDEKKNCLLIVDDDESNLAVLKHILEKDYIVYTANNGPSALEKAAEYLPDLVLLDIVMTGMDGYQVLAALKNAEATQKIPVMFITGLNSDEYEEKGLSLDAVDYIGKPFTTEIVKLRVRNQIQIINELRAIERISLIDGLTNIPNRRSFDSRMEMDWKQAVREKTPISILMMDVDKFKIYNDVYGHQQGDVVLKIVANLFMHSLRRATDFAARWGGEEFAVLLPNTPLSGALGVAEYIRSEVEKIEIPCDDKSVTKVTVSIGVNTLIPDASSSPDQFIAGADEALYMAKQAGRNRVAHRE